MALGYANEAGKEYDTAIAEQHRYATTASSDKATKIQALKDITLDPHKIGSPYDALSQSLNRWKSVAADSAKYTPEQQQEIAHNYYQRELAPFYKQMGVNALPEDLWMKQAYEKHGALAYEVENSYHSQLVTGLVRGLTSTAQQFEALGGTVVNMLGLALQDVKHDVGSQYDKDRAKSIKEKGFFQTAEDTTQSQIQSQTSAEYRVWDLAHTLGNVSKLLQHYNSQDEFWSHVVPAKGFTDSASSFISEGLATLPLFGAIDGGVKALGANSANLTKILAATPGGKVVAKALLSGAEGTAYGVLTRPNEDKTQAWKDALTFAAMGTIFHVAGEKLKLRDAIIKSGDTAKLAEHDDEMERVRLSTQEDKRVATPEEKRAAYVKEHAANISVGGTHYQRQVYKQALKSILSDFMEGLNPEQRKAKYANMLKEDPAHGVPLNSARNFILDTLSGKPEDFIKTPEGKKFLSDEINNLIAEAEDHLNQTDLVSQATEAHSAPDMSKPETKLTMSTFMDKAKAEAAEAIQAGAKIPQDAIEARAKELYAKAQVKAAALSEQKRTADPHEEAIQAADKRTAKNKQDITSEAMKKRQSTATTGAASRGRQDYGLPAGASASHNTKYIQYLKGKVPSLKSGELRDFYEGMEPKDFSSDLLDHFYPKDLKDAGVYFETEHEAQLGKNNPNFLAFMYNFKDQMPKELGEELDRRLEDTLKFEKHFKGYRVTDDQKWHYALQMYNHVDMFVGSTSFLKDNERNVFRSTQSDLLNPTKYQHELLQEFHHENVKLLRDMFPKPGPRKQALIAYKILGDQLTDIFKQKPTLASALRFRESKDFLDAHMVSEGDRAGESLIPWRF